MNNAIVLQLNTLIQNNHNAANGAYWLHSTTPSDRRTLSCIVADALNLNTDHPAVAWVNCYGDIVWFDINGKMHTLWDSHGPYDQLRALVEKLNTHVRNSTAPIYLRNLAKAEYQFTAPGQGDFPVAYNFGNIDGVDTYLARVKFLMGMMSDAQDRGIDLPANIMQLKDVFVTNAKDIKNKIVADGANNQGVSYELMITEFENLLRAYGGLAHLYEVQEQDNAVGITYVISTIHLYEWNRMAPDSGDFNEYPLYRLLTGQPRN